VETATNVLGYSLQEALRLLSSGTLHDKSLWKGNIILEEMAVFFRVANRTRENGKGLVQTLQALSQLMGVSRLV
jgi:hypothetical protein